MKMGKHRTGFTAEMVRTLKDNPYTLRVTNSRLSVTLEAKRIILELYEVGKTCRQIVTELGYDPKILGEQRMKNMVRNTRREAATARGLHEGYARSSGSHMDKEEIAELDCSPASYAKLKNEVIYLREEVEFLKKISQQVISGKRGK